MQEMLTHHPTACFIGLLLVVAITSEANRLGLIAWLSWLDLRESRLRGRKRHGQALRECWRIRE